MIEEVEEKLWQVDGLREDEVSPLVIDMTEEDSDSETDDCLDNGVGDDFKNDDMDYDFPEANNNSDVSKPCKVCHAAEPPNIKKCETDIQWYQCEYCEDWLHDKCCTGAARKENMCLWCYSILHHRNLSQPLLFEPMDTEA